MYAMKDVAFKKDDSAADSVLMVGSTTAYRTQIVDGLEAWGLRVTEVDNIDEIWTAFSEPGVVAVLLDLATMDAHGDSTHLVAKLRMLYDGEIFVLASTEDAVDRIINLEAGADHYVPQTWSAREVLSQLRACLRRKPTLPSQSAQSSERWTLDPRRWDVVGPDGIGLQMNSREFMIMSLLVEKRGEVVTRDEISMLIFRKIEPKRHYTHISNMISKIRHKLRKTGNTNEDIRGVPKMGYIYSGDMLMRSSAPGYVK